jgi:hypothetical protein
MTQEKADAIYGRLMREYGELQAQQATYGFELKRIGDNFKSLGAALDDPRTLTVDWPSFEKDASGLRKTLQGYLELAAQMADKQREIERIGQLPRFD